jgi:hypothetical protein
MGKSASEMMLQRVHEVVRAAKLFEEFERAEDFTLRVENEPYMSLTIKSWPTPDPLQGEQRRVLVAHYYTAKGREYPDPELEMTERGFPVRLRQTVFGVMETPVLWRDPGTQQVLVNVKGKRDMAELLRIWAKNIKEQGFIDAASLIVTDQRRTEVIASEHPQIQRLPIESNPEPRLIEESRQQLLEKYRAIAAATLNGEGVRQAARAIRTYLQQPRSIAQTRQWAMRELHFYTKELQKHEESQKVNHIRSSARYPMWREHGICVGAKAIFEIFLRDLGSHEQSVDLALNRD